VRIQSWFGVLKATKFTQNGDKMILFHCGKPCRFVPVFGIGKDGEPVPTITPTYDGKSVPTITPTYERVIYYTKQPQLLEIKKAMTQMISRLSGEVPIAVDLF